MIVAAEVRDFNPRSPHGERQWLHHRIHFLSSFQSTLPAWGATLRFFTLTAPFVFQSTLPAWGATYDFSDDRQLLRISIHAPRMGSDEVRERSAVPEKDFNPRSPHGERRSLLPVKFSRSYFNPRSPHGERLDCRLVSKELKHFNPRSPHGERQQKHEISSLFL